MEKKIKKWLDKGLTTAAKASVNSASFVCFYEPEISENLKNILAVSKTCKEKRGRK